ncbi:MAG: PRC-barrel domain-containing protein, partial [Desulfovibrionaceae bacterium]|nr:PRC-barrel domain-containing protein [Desulfovibrionaceae bacterium]
IDSNQLPPLSEGEIYRYSLFGFRIYAHGSYVGILEDIQDIAGQELWYIRADCGSEILFPKVEQFIDSMDFENQIIHILPPSGLLELYIPQK